jgi:phosphoribosylaminoimidazolecarboxamide formyltransferase/IMP cyclohydrolase
MKDLIKIKTALISVYDKTDIVPLAQFLRANDVKIISTGGSFNILRQNNIDVIEISDFTGFPEMMDGRVKTLHPKIHGGLLGREEDAEVVRKHGIEKIDLVIVNLYPFEETVKAGGTFEEIIEKIDIGGPSMLRSGAKNFKYTTVITDVKDYPSLKKELMENNFSTSLEFRENLAKKVFSLTAFYDGVISGWFNKDVFEGELKTIPLRKKQHLRYGENPHQKASFYEIPLFNNSFVLGVQLQGKELSYNNIADADASCEASYSFDEPAVCIVKHANPCGLATARNILDAYELAFSSDPKSAFGGIVALNREVDGILAERIKSHFYEVIIAPKFTKEALDVLSKKPNLRLIKLQNHKQTEGVMFKNISGGLLMQNTDVNTPSFEVASGNISKMDDIEFSFKSVKFFKSNAIVITRNTQVVAFGCGQTSRVDAMEIACKKLALSEINPSECVLSSDAFFPFTDNLELAKKYGITTVVAPSGSIKDEEVKEYAKQNGINLVFAKSRHFRH